MSGGYGPGGYPGQGYGAPDYEGPDYQGPDYQGNADPDGPEWQRGGQQQHDDSVWQSDQGYAAPAYGGQDFGGPGYDDRAYGELAHDEQRYGGEGYGYPGQPPQRGTGAQPPQRGTGAQPAQRGTGGMPQLPPGYDQPGYNQPGYDPRGTGPRRGTGGYDQRGYNRAQDQGDGSFLPGFGRRDEFAGGHVGGRAPERDGRYDYDDYDDRRAPRGGWPDGRDPGGRDSGGRGPGDRGPGGRGPGNRGPDPYGRGDDPRDRDDWDDRDRRRRRRRLTRWAPRILVLIVVLAIVVGGLVGGLDIYHKYEARYHPADYAGAGIGPTVMVQVQNGEDASELAPALVQLGVVASDRAFVIAAENSTDSTGLEPGFYLLNHHMQATLAYAALLNPKNRVQTLVTIPEGKRAVDVIAILAAKTKIPLKDFQQVLAHPAQLGLPSYADGKVEGYLFPATYAIVPHETALEILQAMVQRFDVEAQQINIVAAAKAVKLTPTQLIIEASMAQAEGGSVSDYPKIAEVIHNRLAIGMHLQFDSTVLYGLGKYAVSATDAELAINTPYNTYLHAGLPAGPISNPGDAAIEGILHPDHGNWLYFLTVPGGKSQFSDTCLQGQC